VLVRLWKEGIAMPVHIDDLHSTVEVQSDAEESVPTRASAPDELAERMREERDQRDRDRLRAEGYAD
jgi:hypothetical protein